MNKNILIKTKQFIDYIASQLLYCKKISFDTSFDLFQTLSQTPESIFEIKEIDFTDGCVVREYCYQGNIVGLCRFSWVKTPGRSFITTLVSINGLPKKGFYMQNLSKEDDQRFIESRKSLLALKGVEADKYGINVKNLGEFMLFDIINRTKEKGFGELVLDSSSKAVRFYKKIFKRFAEKKIINEFDDYTIYKYDGCCLEFKVIF